MDFQHFCLSGFPVIERGDALLPAASEFKRETLISGCGILACA
jgi:hypothetical protein